MKLKELIKNLEEKLAKEKNVEVENALKDLKDIDENIKEFDDRIKAVKKIQDEQYEWLNIKDV